MVLSSTSLGPKLVRVDAERERALVRRYEVDALPALVLAWSNRWTVYTGPHQHLSMAEFGAAHTAPLVEMISDEKALEALLEQQRSDRRVTENTQVLGRVLLLGFFNDPDDQAEEIEDLSQAAQQLRRQRTDVPVRAAAVRANLNVIANYGRRLRWFSHSPCAVLLVDGAVRGGEYRLDEQDEAGLDLAGWAARAAVADLGELTANNFAAYAATDLPMMIAFVRPSEDNRALKRELRLVT